MDLASELRNLEPRVRPSPWKGFERVNGFGVMALPFSSGHVLALRVFPENDFAPYTTIWHRSPDRQWEMYVDSPSPDTACPRYFGTALSRVQASRIQLNWTGRSELRVSVDQPRLEWQMSMASSPLLRVMNVVSPRLSGRLWRNRVFLRFMERMAAHLLGMGDVTLHGTAPNGQQALLMPQRVFFIASSHAELEGESLGHPVRSRDNPLIGSMGLPARPTFAIGEAYFQILDQAEYKRTTSELMQDAQPNGGIANRFGHVA